MSFSASIWHEHQGGASNATLCYAWLDYLNPFKSSYRKQNSNEERKTKNKTKTKSKNTKKHLGANPVPPENYTISAVWNGSSDTKIFTDI